jgi:hypothetical protein
MACYRDVDMRISLHVREPLAVLAEPRGHEVTAWRRMVDDFEHDIASGARVTADVLEQQQA